MTSHYNIIFEGKTAPGKDIDSVKKSLMTFLKTDARGIDRLFSDKPVVIRKNVDTAKAEKYRKAFESAGAECSLMPVEVSGGVGALDQPHSFQDERTFTCRCFTARRESALAPGGDP